MRRRVCLLGAVLLASLAGCVTAPPPLPNAPVPLQGRLALRVAEQGDQPAQVLSASFELTQLPDRGELRLMSPLGTIMAVARWQPDEVSLDTGSGPQRYPSLDALARQALGEDIPLAALPDWLAGRPWAGAPAHSVGDEADPSKAQHFTQLEWTVDARRLRSEGQIEARRARPPGVWLRVRLDS